MLSGVYNAKKKNGIAYYRSNITYKNKHISLGSFESENDAHRAYSFASCILRENHVSFEDFAANPDIKALPFKKSVSLFNFRDNNVYIKTPIYLRSNFFSYFLSPSEELKFDVDDLFYYSSHMIQKRGGYYFVADYGMQVNILSRFGILPHAVSGKDYVFVNGDPLDLRYSNIELINPYHGVKRNMEKGQVSFSVYLNINGTWKTGTFNTVTEAAIAYNKAADLAKKHGVNKNYPENYIPDMKPSEYAKIYTDIKLNNKFITYLENIK